MRCARLLTLPIVIVALIAGAFAADASAQDTFARGRAGAGLVGLDFEIRGSYLQPGASVAFSDFNDPISPAPDDPKTDDTFDEYWSIGTGAGADISMPLFLAADPKKAMHITLGPFIGFDHYELLGDEKEYDNGAVLEVDNWTVTTFFAGLQMRVIWGYDTSPIRFMIGVDVAGGMVSYGGVSADFIATPGATPLVGHVFDSSTTSAFRGVGRTGLLLRLSHTAQLIIHASGGVAMFGAPSGNDDPDNPFGDAEPEAWMPIIAGVGLSLRLRF